MKIYNTMKTLKFFLFALALIAGMALDSEGVYGWVALAATLTSGILLLCILIAEAKSKKGGRL